MGSTENQETNNKKIIKIEFDRNKKLKDFGEAKHICRAGLRLEQRDKAIKKLTSKKRIPTLREKMTKLGSNETTKLVAQSRKVSMSLAPIYDIAKKLSIKSEQFHNNLGQGIWKSLQEAQSLNQSTAKNLVEMMTLPKIKHKNPWESLALGKGTASFLNTSNVLKDSLKPLSTFDLLNKVQTAPPTRLIQPLDSKTMAKDKARERKAHEAMIEMKETQVQNGVILSQMANILVQQAKSMQSLVKSQETSEIESKNRYNWTLSIASLTLIVSIIAALMNKTQILSINKNKIKAVEPTSKTKQLSFQTSFFSIQPKLEIPLRRPKINGQKCQETLSLFSR